MTVGNFFGYIILIVGFLIAFLSGACSLAFIIGGATGLKGSNIGAALGGLGIVAAVGGVPFLLGWGMIVLGKNMTSNSSNRD